VISRQEENWGRVGLAMISLKELHDATLTGLEVDWASGDLRCNFKASIGERTAVRLLAHGLTSLKCPRLFPWGKSASVNSARVDKREREILLFIEMQSGDVIEAIVEDVVLE
jgi:hypothetical protein